MSASNPFALYLNDLELELITKDTDRGDTGLLNFYLLLYADDIIIFSEKCLHKGLIIFRDYCQKWKLTVNVNKSKVRYFRLAQNWYSDMEIQT